MRAAATLESSWAQAATRVWIVCCFALHDVFDGFVCLLRDSCEPLSCLSIGTRFFVFVISCVAHRSTPLWTIASVVDFDQFCIAVFSFSKVFRVLFCFSCISNSTLKNDIVSSYPLDHY